MRSLALASMAMAALAALGSSSAPEFDPVSSGEPRYWPHGINDPLVRMPRGGGNSGTQGSSRDTDHERHRGKLARKARRVARHTDPGYIRRKKAARARHGISEASAFYAAMFDRHNQPVTTSL